MPRPAKSPWDFGELFPAEQTRKILSVSELTQQIKRLLEKSIGEAWVTGEISNLRAQSSGHIYFTLKDAGAQLACVLFRGEAGARRELLQDGQKVLLRGDVTVYEARGQHQLIVREVELRGVGALQAAFERLKQKLEAEGLFAPGRKRPLPRYAQRIGLVTSPTGAAMQDILTVVQRRHAALQIVLAPCRVQGEGAAGELAAAIRDLNAFNATRPANEKLDLLVLARGGGSLEDLWAFNEEVVARAIFDSALPVVSAVGHEIDFTISDFVADLRAPTPSAAAEIITEGMFAARQWLAGAADLLRLRTHRQLEQIQDDLSQLRQRFMRCHPRRRLEEQSQRLDEAQAALGRTARRQARDLTTRWETLARRLVRLKPSQALQLHAERWRQLRRRLAQSSRQVLLAHQNRTEELTARLRLLSPEQTLARGYSITSDERTGAIIRDAARVKPGQRLKTRVHQGEIRSVAGE